MTTRLMWFVIAALGGTWSIAPVAASQLVFSQPHIALELPLDTPQVSVAFTFKNAAESLVRILEIRTECNCVQTSMVPLAVEAGRTSEIVLRFRARLRNGTDAIRAEVITDRNENYPISVTAKLRSYIEVTPRTLHWRKGEPREPREFIVSPTGLGKLRFTHVGAVKDIKAEM